MLADVVALIGTIDIVLVASPPRLVADDRVVLPCVSWETYERLLADDEERRVPRMTYDQGCWSS